VGAIPIESSGGIAVMAEYLESFGKVLFDDPLIEA
jgi:hypothetical protein